MLNQEAILTAYKKYCHTGKLHLDGDHSKEGWVIPEGTPKSYLCVPSVDDALGASFDCSAWDSDMFNVVYCNMELVGKYLDHVLLKNHMSDIGRFYFAFGRSSPQSSVWLSDTDWVIFDHWSKSLIKTSKLEDLTFEDLPEAPQDLVTAADCAVYEYYTRCLSHGKWQRLNNEPKLGSPPEQSPLSKSGAGSDSTSGLTPILRSSLDGDFLREGPTRKRKRESVVKPANVKSDVKPAVKPADRFSSKPIDEGQMDVPDTSRDSLLAFFKEREEQRGRKGFNSWRKAYDLFTSHCKKFRKKTISFDCFCFVRDMYRPDLRLSHFKSVSDSESSSSCSSSAPPPRNPQVSTVHRNPPFH